jgi:hypothetical protein
MNGRLNIPPIAPLLFIGLAVLAIKSLFSSDAEKKPETAPAVPKSKRLPVPTGNKSIPPYSSRKVTASPPAMIPIYFAPPHGKIPAPPPPIIPTAKAAPEIPLPARKKVITREDMAKTFSGGTRGLTRTAAVAALQRLGFGKTAAYDALSPDGRFSAWLKCAPDGIMTWTG